MGSRCSIVLHVAMACHIQHDKLVISLVSIAEHILKQGVASNYTVNDSLASLWLIWRRAAE